MPHLTSRPRVRHVSLREDFARSSAPYRVDREAGVIHQVKVIGYESVNGMEGMRGVNRRVYTRDALARATPLYEGAVVNVDHATKPGEQRSAYDRLGTLRNVYLGEDGLYADLHLLKSHPLAERLLEAAEKLPELFGMSHSSEAIGEVKGDAFLVTEIQRVNSVDLVADPATTNSLFESKQGGHRVATIKEDMGYSTMATEDDMGGGWRKHLGEMVKAMCEDEGMDHDTMVAKVKHALGTLKKGEDTDDMEKAANGTKETEEGDDLQDDAEHAAGADTGAPAGKKPRNETTSEAISALRNSTDPAVRTLLERVDRLETKARVQARIAKAHELCEAAELPEVAITDLFIETLVRAPSEKAMKQLVQERRSLVVSKKPRTGTVGNTKMDAKSFARFLKNGPE
jgi:hypothetical protein